MRRTIRPVAALAAMVVIAAPWMATTVAAQEAPDGVADEPVVAKPPPIRPKPAPHRKPAVKRPAADPAPGGAAPASASTPPPKAAAEPVKPAEPSPQPDPVEPPVTPAANLPGLTVSCDGKAALYEGPTAVAVWVTRSGAVVVENPLRPLTPETTRVLQVVIGGKAATAYGPDLFALRRGGSPAALEAALGGQARWDAAMATLPDTLAIVSEAGAPLASLAFRECGEAPAVTAPPSAAKARKPAARGAAKPDAPKAPPGFQLPQGAIP